MKSDAVRKGPQAAPHRSLLNALGMTPEEMRKPMVGIVSSYNEIVPGHMNLDKIVEAVKLGVAMAGGTPVVFPAIAVCDGIAMGHVGMKYSLVTRDLIADSTECMALAHQFDALVMVPNCDKNVPGLLMAAARVNVPTVFVSGGPMLAGHKACRMIEKFNDKMKIRISRPLVTETSDYYNIVDIFKHRLTDKNRLYVFMGHGSDHFANAAYPALDYHFKNADMNNVFVGTVEGFPDLETVISHAIKTDIKNVTLLPFMLVCGDHAKNDMAVEWKEEFENNGFNVECDLTGLGEIKEMQDMYAEHLRNVWGQ